MQLIPTTNPETDFLVVEKWLSEVKDLSTWIQVDVADGILAKPQTFSLELLNRLDTNLDKNIFDIHLMVKEPINWIQKCLHVQASRITGQVEMMRDRSKFVSIIKDAGLEAGLAFDSSTPLDNDIPKDTDLILLMGRPMGYDPLPFDSSIFDKIKKLKDQNFTVAVDGGVDAKNFSQLVASGVDIIYSYTNFFTLKNLL